MAPGIELPQRASRGKRMRQAVEEEEGDEDFWNQEFFAEEAQDIDYQESDEEEDVPDSDFDLSEGDDDDDEEVEVKEVEKKKVLKPPGAAKRPKPAKPKSPKARTAAEEDDQEGDEGEDDGTKPSRPPKPSPAPVFYEAPTLRRSTVARVAVAERERQQQQQHAPRRRTTAATPAPQLTQAELLAEAAYTELDNIASLQMLLAREEETKKKAMVVKKAYAGPSVKYRSRRVGEEELTTFELCNTRQPPPWMRHRAQLPPTQPMCCVTGQPAKYKDPKTGLYYATAAALQQIRSSRGLPGVQQAQPRLPAAAAGAVAEDVVALVADLYQQLHPEAVKAGGPMRR